MHIILIGTAYPYRGGLAAFNERMAKELLKEGHQVELVTFKLQYPTFLFPGKTQLSTEKKAPALSITRSIHTLRPLNWIKVGRALRRKKPDLVLIKFWLPFMGPSFGCILRQIKKNKHTKIISVLDNVIPHKKRIGDGPFTRYFLKPVDGFIAMSKSVLQDLRTFTKEKPALLSPHPLYDNFGTPIPQREAQDFLKLDPGYKYLLFFGLIRDYKGLDLLIEAMAEANTIPQNVKLVIAGESYSKKAFYKTLIARYHLNTKIIFHNKFIPDSEVKYYFSACDLVVQPYKSATQSGVTQIAYHFEKPMVVTDVGGLKEMCPDGKVGYVVAPSPTEIAAAIRRFFEKKETADLLKANIKEEKKKYTWTILTQNIFRLYEKI